MAGDGDFKAGMGSMTTLKEKGSNPRGSNTEDNFAF